MAARARARERRWSNLGKRLRSLLFTSTYRRRASGDAFTGAISRNSSLVCASRSN